MATIQTLVINLDLIPGKTLPVVHVSQGDAGSRQLRFNLFNNGANYKIPSNVTTITLTGCTTSGAGFSYECTFTANNDYCTVTLRSAMTQKPGGTMCELRLSYGSNVLGSGNFMLMVESDPMMDVYVSESDYESITASLATVNTQVELAKSWAVGGTGQRSGENTNNAKYYSDLAHSELATYDDRINNMIAGVPQPNAEILDARTWYDGTTVSETLGAAIRAQINYVLNQASGGESVLVKPWSATKSYSHDTLVLHNSKVYRAKYPITGEFDPSDWDEVLLEDIYRGLAKIIAPLHNASTSYNVGDLCVFGGKLWECTVPSRSSFTEDYWTERSVAYLLNALNVAKYIASTFDSQIAYTFGSIILRDDGLYQKLKNGGAGYIASEWEKRTVADAIANTAYEVYEARIPWFWDQADPDESPYEDLRTMLHAEFQRLLTAINRCFNGVTKQWNTFTTYHYGDCVTRPEEVTVGSNPHTFSSYRVYRCKVDTATVGTWNDNQWELGTLKEYTDDRIDSLNDSLKYSIAPEYDESQTYHEWDLLWYENVLYRCVSSEVQGVTPNGYDGYYVTTTINQELKWLRTS